MAKRKQSITQQIAGLSTPQYALGDLPSFQRDDVLDLRGSGINTLGDLADIMVRPPQTTTWPSSFGPKQLDRITDAALVEIAKALGGLPKEITDIWEIPKDLSKKVVDRSSDRDRREKTSNPSEKAGEKTEDDPWWNRKVNLFPKKGKE
jgi:hypothetical protein